MSGLPTPDEFWLSDIEEESTVKDIKIEYAAVVALTINGEPILQFPRESLPSKKTYRRMKHYIPAVGDRVQLVDETIMGGWKVPGVRPVPGLAKAGALSAAAINDTTLDAGIYTNSGDGLLNAAGTAAALGGWWHVIVMQHTHYNGFGAQIAVPLNVSAGIYWRRSNGTSWSEWAAITATI